MIELQATDLIERHEEVKRLAKSKRNEGTPSPSTPTLFDPNIPRERFEKPITAKQEAIIKRKLEKRMRGVPNNQDPDGMD